MRSLLIRRSEVIAIDARQRRGAPIVSLQKPVNIHPATESPQASSESPPEVPAV